MFGEDEPIFVTKISRWCHVRVFLGPWYLSITVKYSFHCLCLVSHLLVVLISFHSYTCHNKKRQTWSFKETHTLNPFSSKVLSYQSHHCHYDDGDTDDRLFHCSLVCLWRSHYDNIKLKFMLTKTMLSPFNLSALIKLMHKFHSRNVVLSSVRVASSDNLLSDKTGEASWEKWMRWLSNLILSDILWRCFKKTFQTL